THNHHAARGTFAGGNSQKKRMNALLDGIDRMLNKVTQNACLVAGWALIILSVVIALNVFARKLFNYSVQGVDEYGGYCLAISAAIGFSHAAYEKAHIRIAVATDFFPVHWRAVCDVLALTLLTALAWFLALKATDIALTSHAMQARATSALRTPLAVPQAAWAAAMCWFGLVLSIQLLRACAKFVHKDWVGIDRDYGASSIEEEVEEELAIAQSRLRGAEQRSQ